MIEIQKKIVNDENGNPSDVIIPWKQFKQIEEILGLDLDRESINELQEARKDRENGKAREYISLDEI